MALKKKHSFEERLPYWLAFLIPIIIMIGVFAGKSIYPFGNQTFLRTDMYHQYAPFFMDFLNRLKEGQSLTYAWEIGLGSNYTALIAYYLSSPFNLLLLILPAAAIVEFMTYLIVFKIGLCGLTMAYYLGKKNKTSHLGIAFFGICYALSGYLAAYSWNIMWLDCLWLAPLIILGLERLVKENKPFLYCITLGLAILTNYYISIMLCIYMVVYFLCLIIMLPDKPLKTYLAPFGRFALYSLIAGGLGAVLLIPAAYALMGTASADSTFPQSIVNYFSIFDMLARHLVDVEVEIGLDHWPNLFCGVATLLFMPMYYLNRRIPYKEKIVKTCLIFFLFLSFNLNIPNYIWHGFHYPNSLPCRQSFLYNILVLSMCFEGYKGFKEIRKGQLVAIFWGVTAFILLAEQVVDESQNIAFHSYYASLVFVGLYTLFLYLYKTRKLQMTTAFILAMGVLVLEMGLNTAVTSVTITSRTEYWKNTDSYQELLAGIEDQDFYRVEKVNRRTKNDAAWIGYHSASIFSSTAHAGVSDLYKKLGLEGNTNAYSFTGATPMTSSLLSVRYMLDTATLPDSPLYHLCGTTETGISLYENDYTLPLGFMIPADSQNYWDTTSGNPARVQNSFVQLTANTGDVLIPLTGSTSGSQFTTSVTTRSHVYVFVENSSIENVTANIGDRQEVFSNVNRRYLLDLGYCEPDQEISLTTKDNENLSATAYAFDDQVWMDAYQVLSKNTLDITSFTDTLTSTCIQGTVTADADGLLFTSIPFDKGWTVKVDGVIIPTTDFVETFLAIPMISGTHSVELTYMPQGLIVGACISLISLVLLLLCLLIYFLMHRRKPTKPETDVPTAEPLPAPTNQSESDSAETSKNPETEDTPSTEPTDKTETETAASPEMSVTDFDRQEESDSAGQSEPAEPAEKEPTLQFTPMVTRHISLDPPRMEDNSTEDFENISILEIESTSMTEPDSPQEHRVKRISELSSRNRQALEDILAELENGGK